MTLEIDFYHKCLIQLTKFIEYIFVLISIGMLSRKNSRTVTENLLSFSEQSPKHSRSTLPFTQQIPYPKSRVVSQLNCTKDKNTLRSTTLSFKTYSSIQKGRSSQMKRRDLLDQFLKKRQIPLTKVSLRYNRINLALRDMSEVSNQTCFMSKKLSINESHTQTARKFKLSTNGISNVNNQMHNSSVKRIIIDPHKQKIRQLKNINQVKRKYTFFGKPNKTII